MIVTATKGQWFELPAFRAARVVQKSRNQGTAIAISETVPTLSPYDESQDIYGILVQVGDAVEIDGVQQGSKVYVFASGEDAILSVNEIDSRTFPDGSFQGTRALTVQFYPEANVKNGLQYYLRRAFTGSAVAGVTNGAFTAPGDKRYVYLVTGSKTVTVKDRAVKFIGGEFALRIYGGPTLTPSLGDITISNYRADGGAIPTTIITAKEVDASDITDFGTEIGDAEYYFGGSSQGQRIADSILQGRERILPPNTAFIVEIEMTTGNSGRFEYFIDWYEGDLDLPLP